MTFKPFILVLSLAAVGCTQTEHAQTTNTNGTDLHVSSVPIPGMGNATVTYVEAVKGGKTVSTQAFVEPAYARQLGNAFMGNAPGGALAGFGFYKGSQNIDTGQSVDVNIPGGP